MCHFAKDMLKSTKAGREISVKQLPEIPKGQPLLLGPDLDWQVQDYLRVLHEVGGVVNTLIVIGAATGIIRKHERQFACRKWWKHCFN